jgi:EAL domain-containing protein (putative c-di-GMP-specific phosphodiesterase class I)/GGDEF domain-containing protein
MARADRGQKIAVAVLSVDRFVQVRGAIGFGQADALMAEIGQALQALLPGDPVARISNSFLGIAFPAADAEDASRRCARLQHALGAPIRLGETTIDISLTVGLAILPDHASRPGALINRANVAVEQAHARQSKLAVFDPKAYGDPAATLSLMSEMLVAIVSGDISIDLQPKLDLTLGRTTGAEALVRWRHPTRGVVAPDTFIPLAEETGHIRVLTEHVLGLAIAQQGELAAAGHPIAVAVNLSGRLLAEPEFADRALAMAAGACGELYLEITETAVVANPVMAMELIARFSAAGLKISIDDFGSGLSALAYLKRIRADELKIDKAFILGMAEGDRDALLVRSTIDLAHDLGLRVTAEGVETAGIRSLLQAMGCDLAQGYGIARPMPLAELMVYLEREADAQPDAPPAASASR